MARSPCQRIPPLGCQQAPEEVAVVLQSLAQASFEPRWGTWTIEIATKRVPLECGTYFLTLICSLKFPAT